MWLEVKAGITIIGCFIFAIIIGLSGNMVFMILGIMGIATMLFGDMLIGYKLVNTDAINYIDPVGPDQILIDLHLVGGGKRCLKARKGPKGTWQFTYHKHKATVIDDGNRVYRLTNGNPILCCHESYDHNVDPVQSKYLEQEFKTFKTGDVRHLFSFLKQKEKNEEVS